MRLVIGASALALFCAPAIAAQVKWVPLDKVERGPTNKMESSAAAAQQSSAPQTDAATAPAPTIAQPVTPPPAASQVAPSTGQQPLALTCLGGGTASKATGAMVYGYGGWASIVGHKDRGFNDQVDIRLFNGDDRIRIPRTMLPGIHGGDHGWFKLHDVIVDARSIRASAGVGILHNPKIFIDRVTGTISISGKSGDYAGQCEVIDANAPAKF